MYRQLDKRKDDIMLKISKLFVQTSYKSKGNEHAILNSVLAHFCGDCLADIVTRPVAMAKLNIDDDRFI